MLDFQLTRPSMLLVSSTLDVHGPVATRSRAVAEVRWFLANYMLLNAVWFVIGLVLGGVLIATSADGTIAGSSRSAIEQVFWFAVGVVVFLPLIAGLPLLAMGLLVWRALIRLIGRPRLAAYLLVGFIVIGEAVLIPRSAPLTCCCGAQPQCSSMRPWFARLIATKRSRMSFDQKRSLESPRIARVTGDG